MPDAIIVGGSGGGGNIGAFQVGDMLRTIRTDLGEDWALCNGAAFDPTLYPDLASITPDMTAYGDYATVTNFGSPVGEITKIDTYYYVLCRNGYLYRSTTPTVDSWTSKQLTTTSPTYFEKLFYHTSSSRFIACHTTGFYWATDPMGTWTAVAAPAGWSLDYWIMEGSTIVAAAVTSDGYLRTAFTTNGNTFSYGTVLSDVDFTLSGGICFLDNYWFFGTLYQGASTYIMRATALDGSWSNVLNNTLYGLSKMQVYDGKIWFITNQSGTYTLRSMTSSGNLVDSVSQTGGGWIREYRNIGDLWFAIASSGTDGIYQGTAINSNYALAKAISTLSTYYIEESFILVGTSTSILAHTKYNLPTEEMITSYSYIKIQ